MINEYISTGKTIDDAVEAGLEAINMDRDDVSVEVIDTPSKGFLGIGSTPAKVKLTYETADEKPVIKEKKETVKEKKAEPKKKAEEKTCEANIQETAVQGDKEKLDKIKAFVEELLLKMKIEGCEAEVSYKEEGAISVSVKGDKTGSVIGRHGETLDAIQYIVSLYTNKDKSQAFTRVTLDAEGYRAKRKETLEHLAKQKASMALKKKGNVTLEPMQAYERRIIHSALQEYPNITTYSVGEEPRRRLVIAYKGK